MRLSLLLIAAISVFILTGCGVRGSLKTPPPLWGDKNKPVQTEPAQEQDEDDEFDTEVIATPSTPEPADLEIDEDDNYLEGPY